MLSTKETMLLWGLLGASAVFGLLSLFGGVFQNKLLQKKKRVGISKMLMISAFLVGAILFLHYAILYFRHRIPLIAQGGEISFALQWWEDAFDAVAKTLRTFTLEEDYGAMIRDVRDLARTLLPDNSLWITVCSLYGSFLWLGAPIAGGAIIFEILASVFPRLRLWLARGLLLNPKLYFSCLNEATVTLIGSIHKMTRFSLLKPVIIVTGVQIDKLEEDEHELLQDAKRLGAICIREDIVHVSKNYFGRRQFFLISESNADNLRDMIGLTDNYNYRFMKKAEIYLFSENDTYVRVEKRLREKLMERPCMKEEQLPRVMPVHVYKKLITKMLVDVPLYEPLVHKMPDEKGKKQLQVTILGNGAIGMEMLMTTYWMGQLLDHTLTINVVSQDAEEVFWGKLDSINTELQHTLQKAGQEAAQDILYYNKNEENAEPYCAIKYIRCDVKGEGFIGLLQEKANASSLLDTDYFFVALGADDVNLELANTINRYMGQHHINTAPNKKTVISYVVYDTALANTLNGKRRYSSRNNGIYDIYMQAVGCLEDVYCASNVYRVEDDRLGLEQQINYLTFGRARDRLHSYQNRVKDDYSYWSNRAQALHTKYKLYSAGMIEESVFTKAADQYRAYVQAAYAQCVKQLTEEKDSPEVKLLCDRLAWLEHRRWNAYMRTCGFRQPKAYENYLKPGDMDSYKQMELKLHPCLVECSQSGRALEQDGERRVCCIGCQEVPGENCRSCEKFEKLDRLDRLSLDLRIRGIYKGDFKVYDYPKYCLLPRETAKKWWEDLFPKKEKASAYVPAPVSTAQVVLPRELESLSEDIAKNVHENWAQGRMAQGWTYGKKRNDKRKKTPCLVPYEKLSEEEKDYDRNTAGETLKLIVSLGYRIEKEKENVQDQ